MRIDRPIAAVLVFMCLFGFAAPVSADVRYVDADATGTHDGMGWCTAYLYVRDALAVAVAGDEIRVADGTYTPDRMTCTIDGDCGGVSDTCVGGFCNWATPREQTFQLISGVTINGGYAGCGAPDPDARDVAAYQTILSGDLNGDDVPPFGNNTENSYHVVTGTGTDATATLDGFTITGGNADGPLLQNADIGGGMYNSLGNPTLNACTFANNSAVQGGGIYNDGGSPTIGDCALTDNSADFGGGMYNFFGDPTLNACTFANNSAAHGGGMHNYSSSPSLTDCAFDRNAVSASGGGMYNGYGSSPTLTNCIFTGNTSDAFGGGMSNLFDGSSPVLKNCLFSGNSADIDGGAMRNDGGSPTLINCTIANNYAGGVGGGLSNGVASPSLTNCILWFNTHGAGPPVANAQIDGGTPVVTYSNVQDDVAGDESVYPGVGNVDGNPLFVDPEGPDNVIGTPDDNLYFELGRYPASPCIDAGNNSVVTTLTDLKGKPRMVNDLGYPWIDPLPEPPDHNPIVDMGAYEFQETSITPRLYVDVDATGTPVGTSWSDAFNHLQDALAVASAWPDVVNEIWVAAGTYTPDVKSCTQDKDCSSSGGEPCVGGQCVWNSPRQQTFQLVTSVGIYGGFAGTEVARAYCSATTTQSCLQDSDCPSGETCKDARQFRTCAGGLYDGRPCELTTDCAGAVCTNAGNVTILSGDLNHDDGPDDFVQDFAACFSGTGVALDSENNCQRFDLEPATPDNDVDAADLTRFLADYQYGENSYHVVHAPWTANTVVLDGLTIVAGNADGAGSWGWGGGLFIDSTDPTIRNCAFIGNAAGRGGGGWTNATLPVMTSCRFIGNMSGTDGGGLCRDGGSSISATDCLFRDNAAGADGGGIWVIYGTLIFTDSLFRANAASAWGGAMYLRSSEANTIMNCDFLENTAEHAGAVHFYYGAGGTTITDCQFRANLGRTGGGAMYNRELASNIPTFHNCFFVGNKAQGAGLGGAILNNKARPILYDTILTGNSSLGGGGVMYNYNTGAATLIRCTLTGNHTEGVGGAIYEGTGGTSLINCLMAGNRTDSNGGAMFHGSGPNSTITNSTVVANEAVGSGGGAYGAGIDPVNSIFWGNVDASGGPNEGAQISPPPAIDFSCVQGWTGAWGGACNIGDDPAFISTLPGTWTGTWTDSAIYDANTGQTTFYDSTKTLWPGVDPVNNRPLLNPDKTQYLQAIIVSTAPGQITVWGDFAWLGDVPLPPGVAPTYEINDYRLGAGSPCIDAADNTAISELTDLTGRDRFIDDPNTDHCQNCPTPETDCGTPPVIVDMGAHEYDRGCLDDTECNDNKDCTDDTCVGLVCQYDIDDTNTCSDDDACTGGDTCFGGVCIGTPTDCSGWDGICNVGTCNADGLCEAQPTNEGGWCALDDACTWNYVCVGGVCTGVVRGCNDGNPCTDDWCEDLGGGQWQCHNDPNGILCDDGNLCTENDTCNGAGACEGTPKDCEDGDLCTANSCDPGTGICVTAMEPVGTSCEDGQLCNGVDTCDGAGNCLHVPNEDCNSDDQEDVCGGITNYYWNDAGSGSFTDPNNWMPPGVPGGNAEVRNDGTADNHCVLSAPGEQLLCELTVEATGVGTQYLDIAAGSTLTAGQGTTVGSGGVVDIAGALGGGDVTIHAGGTLMGIGTVTVGLDNSGLVQGTAGETLTVTGSNVLNQSGGVITLPGCTLIAPTVTNKLGAVISGFGTIQANVINEGTPDHSEYGSIVVEADMQFVGDLVNDGLVFIQSGRFTVTGNLSGSGEIRGSFGARSVTEGLTVIGDYHVGQDGKLSIVNGIFKAGGSVDVEIIDSSKFDMTAGTLQMVGLPGTQQDLEVLAGDAGECVTLPDASLFSMDKLHIGPIGSTVRLVDNRDNDGSGQAAGEALYVNELVIDANDTLLTSGFKIYYNSLTVAEGGVVDVPTNLIVIRSDCVGSPLGAAYPHDRRKNRYISFDPNKAGNDGTSVAFRVELTAIALGSCSGAAGAPAQVDFCRVDRGAGDCNTCAGAPAENSCIDQAIDCVSGTCTLTGETCVNDAPNVGGSNVGTVWWVGPENPLNSSVHMLVSQSFRKESTNWANPVHVGDCEVVPEARYGVRAVDVSSGTESDELLVETTLFATDSSSWWGDCVGPLKSFCGGDIRTPECTGDADCIAPETCDRAWTLPEGAVNVDDLTAALWTSAPAPPTTVSAEFTWVDLHGNGSFLPGSQAYDPPNYVINVSDLQQVISAFGGRPYTFYDPADCPDKGDWP